MTAKAYFLEPCRSLDIAYAAEQQAAQGRPNNIINIGMMAAVFFLFYFLIIRPQQKKMRGEGGIKEKIRELQGQAIQRKIPDKAVCVCRGCIGVYEDNYISINSSKESIIIKQNGQIVFDITPRWDREDWTYYYDHTKV